MNKKQAIIVCGIIIFTFLIAPFLARSYEVSNFSKIALIVLSVWSIFCLIYSIMVIGRRKTELVFSYSGNAPSFFIGQILIISACISAIPVLRFYPPEGLAPAIIPWLNLPLLLLIVYIFPGILVRHMSTDGDENLYSKRNLIYLGSLLAVCVLLDIVLISKKSAIVRTLYGGEYLLVAEGISMLTTSMFYWAVSVKSLFLIMRRTNNSAILYVIVVLCIAVPLLTGFMIIPRYGGLGGSGIVVFNSLLTFLITFIAASNIFRKRIWVYLDSIKSFGHGLLIVILFLVSAACCYGIYKNISLVPHQPLLGYLLYKYGFVFAIVSIVLFFITISYALRAKGQEE